MATSTTDIVVRLRVCYSGPMNTTSTICANDVVEREATWLIPGLVPEFALTIVDGDPGQGKSFLTLELAAALSTAHTLGPDGRVPSGRVRKTLIANAEDDIPATLRPRLRGLSADLKHVYFLPLKQGAEREETPFLPEDIGFFERHVRDTGAEVLIIDPVMGYLSPYIKANSDQAVRIALGALRNLADRQRITVVLVRHLNKSGGAKAIYRGGGSIGITGLARSALYVGPNPEDKRVKILAQIKSNLGPIEKPWQFRMVETPELADPSKNLRKVEWLGTADIPMSRLLSERPEALPIEKAEAFLKALFAKGKPILVREVQAKAEENGVTKHTLRNAKESLGIQTERRGKDQYWLPPGKLVEVDAFEKIRHEAGLPQSKESEDE
jgi:AAA domain